MEAEILNLIATDHYSDQNIQNSNNAVRLLEDPKNRLIVYEAALNGYINRTYDRDNIGLCCVLNTCIFGKHYAFIDNKLFDQITYECSFYENLRKYFPELPPVDPSDGNTRSISINGKNYFKKDGVYTNFEKPEDEIELRMEYLKFAIENVKKLIS